MHERNRALLTNARNLRKNMTKEERRLWYDFLKNCPVRFRRQEIFGNYIVDFYCSSEMLAIELDGSQHYEADKQESDQIRTRYLESQGIRVLRFSNEDVRRDFSGVCEAILQALKTPQSASLTAPLSGEPQLQ